MTQIEVLSGDVFDIRDVIERYKELEKECEKFTAKNENNEWDEWVNNKEFLMIAEFLEDVKGYGGDEQWRGDWYPLLFILEGYFETYAQELAEDGDMIKSDVKWPYNHINWETAAKELKDDYGEIRINHETYYYR
jgi:hypothetical protein